MKYEYLAHKIRKALAQYEYTESIEPFPFDGIDGTLLTTPRRAIRSVCTVFVTPSECDSFEKTKDIIEHARANLTSRYARFPYWQEISSFFVLLCSPELFEILRKKASRLSDKTWGHINIILGVIAVNLDTYEYLSATTWSLSYRKKHFKAITNAIEECKK